MKAFITILAVFAIVVSVNSQDTLPNPNDADINEGSIRLIAKVLQADYDYMTIRVEDIVGYGAGVTAAPAKGEELTVKLPGRDKPKNETRIEVDLKEKIDIGALPTSYIVLDFRTIE